MGTAEGEQTKRDLKARREDEGVADVDLRSWLSTFGGDDYQIKVTRKQPRVWEGVEIAGHLDTLTELVDEEYVRERWGGGTYFVMVHQRQQNGQMKYVAGKTLKMSGPPIVQGMTGTSRAPEPAADGSAVNQAMNMMRWTTEQAERRAREAADRAPSSNFDPALVQLIQAPVLEQIRSMQALVAQLQAQLAAKDERIADVLTRRRGDDGPTFQDRMLEKMVDGESSRIESLRANHDSELRQLKEHHHAELERERERMRDDARRAEKQHERELDQMKEAGRTASEATKVAHETRVDGLKAEVARLQGEVSSLKTEVAELRARKEKTLPEQAKEIAAVQEALQAIGVGGKDDGDDDKGVLERIAGAVLDNPEAIGQIIGGVRGGPAGPSPEQVRAQQIQMAQAAQHQQRVMRKRAKRARLAAAQQALAGNAGQREAAPAGEGAAQPSAPPENGAGPQVTADDLRIAVTFMESAMSNGTAPADFAMSARAAIPGDLLTAIGKAGVEGFLAAAAQVGVITDDSPLASQRGRNYAREVSKHLLAGGATP